MDLPPHVEWLVDRIGVRLEREVKRQWGSACGIRSILVVLCQADPTPGKLAVQWLAERLIDRGFLWEDIRAGEGSKVHETLVAFGTHRKSLAKPERNLAAYASLALVWKSVAHLVSVEEDDKTVEPGIRERRRREKAAAWRESTILCDRPGLTVAVPLTEMASKWWGRGTRWCTASDKSTAFEAYDSKAPLIVIVLPDEKLQLFLDPDGEAYLMDAMDEDVKCSFVEERWDQIGGVIMWAAMRSRDIIRYVPERFRYRGMYFTLVREHGFQLKNVPYAMRDREMCETAVMRSGYALGDVHSAFIDHNMCMLAVTRNGSALRDVPLVLRNRTVCMAAVMDDGRALKWVPLELQDRDMCMAAVTRTGKAVSIVPEHLRDQEMFRAAVGQNEHVICTMPPEMRDLDICLDAVSRRGRLVTYVPTKFSQGLQDILAEISSRSMPMTMPETLEKKRPSRLLRQPNESFLQGLREALADNRPCPPDP